MGELMQINSKGDEVAIVGNGTPKSDWTGIDSKIPSNAGQQRPIYNDKLLSNRTSGLSTKFTTTGDLKEFKRQLLEQAKMYGHYTITHAKNPVKSTEMVCIIENHPMFTIESALKMTEDQVQAYDEYDKSNDAEAKLFLTNSLEPTLAAKLHQRVKESDTFPVMFMRLIQLVQVQSIHYFEALKNKIRNRKPSQYAGEDISLMAMDNKEDARELEIAGQYDYNLNNAMVDNFLEAARGETNSYHFELLGLSRELNKELVAVGYMDKATAGQHLQSKQLSSDDICEAAENAYRTLLDKQQWPGARNPNKDTRTPRAFVAEQLTHQELQYRAFALIQQQHGSKSQAKPDDICMNCGEKGHWARDCKAPKSNKPGGKGGKQNRKHNRKPKRENKQGQSWKTTAPKQGEALTQTKSGKVFHWCAHCGRWSTTHGTNGHINEKTKKDLGGAHQANHLHFSWPQPEAWHCSISQVSPWRIVVNLLWSLLRGFLVRFGGLTALLIAVYLVGASLGVSREDVAIHLAALPSVISSTVSATASAVASTFATSRLNYVAPALWFGLIVVGLLPYRWKHWLLGSPPQEFRPFRMTKAKYKRYIRHCRRKRRPSWFSGRRHTRHYGLATRRRRNPKDDALFDLLQHLEQFASGLEFRRVRREGDNWRNIRRHKGKLHRKGQHETRFPGHPKYKTEPGNWTKGKDGWRDQDEQDPSSRFHTTYHPRYDPTRPYTPETDGPPPGEPDFKPYDPEEDAASRQRPWTKPQEQRFDRVLKSSLYDRMKRNERKLRRRSNKPSIYRPTVGNGIPERHFALMTSPAARAFFANGDIPAYLQGLVSTFRAALTGTSVHEEDKVKLYRIIWDSGCTKSISPCKEDFVGPIEPAPWGLQIQGIASGLRVKGIGHVAWSVVDKTGMLRTIKVPAFYVPSAEARLLSISELLHAYPHEHIFFGTNYLELSGSSESEQKTNPIRVELDPQTNLPTSMAYNHETVTSQSFEAHNVMMKNSNLNLSPAEKELLRWHDRLGHLNFKQIQFILRTGVLAHSESARRLQAAASKLTTLPLCPACQFGKQRRRPAPGKTSSVVKDREGVLKKDNLFPGQKVSVDHFVCSTKGRLLHTKGKEDPKAQYTGGCIFVDHASGYVFIEHQVHLNTQETLKAKQACENTFRDYGVIVSEYLSDNGTVFTSKEYTRHLLEFGQVTSFAGVGAHHHNGVAERAIQKIMSCARTMMMHQSMHWPEVASQNLWPLAVDHAVFLWNHVPNPANGLSPHDLLTKTRWPQSELANVQVWGCPVYVLDKKIQDGGKIPRWKPRSTRQIYVGMSKKHASSVPLCLNPETGAITSQYHIVFDSTFSTVPMNAENLPDFGSDAWQTLFGDSIYQYVLDDPTDPLHPPEDEEQAIDEPPPLIARVRENTEALNPPQPLNVVPPPAQPKVETKVLPLPQRETPTVQREIPVPSLPSQAPSMPTVPQVPLQVENPSPLPPVPSPIAPQRENVPPPTPPKPSIPPPIPSQAPPKPSPEPATRRSTRHSNRPRPNYKELHRGKHQVNHATCLQEKCEHQHFQSEQDKQGFCTYFAGFFGAFNTEWQGITDSLHQFFAFKSKVKQDPDTLGWNQAMNSPEREKWCEAAKKEIEELEGKLTWIEVPMSKAKAKIIPGTWVFRVKRNPSGEVTKYKARYCLRGDLEDKTEVEDTFAPTVAWSTVRLFLVLCFILGWTTASVDFSNAFVQAKLDKPKWMHVPRGFVSKLGPGTCLELKKSIYGARDAPRRWSETAIEGFKTLGFKQSEFDPCLLYKKGMIVVLYVDDAGIGAKDPNDIDRLIEDLRKLGFELKKEGDFTSFLGIKLQTLEDGSIELTQTGLIDKILETAKMTDCNPNRVPATGQLGSDPNGPPMDEPWNYRSIVGMLLYLSTNTRPDIAFAVSQVARFSSNPKQSHATAVKTILRYLKRTRTKGMIVKPTGKLNLDLFVDADFCGLYKVEPDIDPNSVRSRTGYVIKLSGCPLTWRSQLQTSITCSTLEAEYNALSSALRALLPLKRMLIEATAETELDSPIQSTISAQAFEDNQGAFYLANNQRITSRTRWYLNKWHWFWQYVNKDGVGPDKFAVHKIDTELQDADYMTKALAPEVFEANRFRVQGW